jgi:hypothetical protein
VAQYGVESGDFMAGVDLGAGVGLRAQPAHGGQFHTPACGGPTVIEWTWI